MVACVVSLSGGVGSWGAARLAVAKHGAANTTLLFADTLIEDEDLYRFLDDIEIDLDVPITRIAEGRTPWEVFHDNRFLGNSMVDPCSRVLKRELIRAWIDEHHPDGVVVVFGIDFTEAHRCDKIRERYLPHVAEFPLIDHNIDKADLMRDLATVNIPPPRLYAMGFPHNNCGGFCVKAGQAQFALLLREMPGRYRAHEQMEEALRMHLGKDVAVMRDRTMAARRAAAVDGDVPGSVPLTMRDFRIRVDRGDRWDRDEWGGCGCAIDDGDDTPSPLTAAIDDE